MSTTYRVDDQGTHHRHVYGSGPADTDLAFERVTVGPSLMAFPQAFWEITSHKIAVMDFAHFQAIVGIGHGDSPVVEDHPTLLQNMKIDEFSWCVERDDGAPGWMFWGSEPHLHASMVSVPVVGKIHWGVVLAGLGLQHSDGRHTKLSGVCNPTCGAIVDSGTSLIAAPAEDIRVITDLVGAVNKDCSNIDSLPTLTLTLGGQEFELPPRAYILRSEEPVLDDSMNGLLRVLAFQPKVEIKTVCRHAFTEMDQETQYGKMWILGIPWLRQYYTTFNRVEKKLYVAPAGDGCRPVSSTNFFLDSAVEQANASALHSGERSGRAPPQPPLVNFNNTRNPWLKRMVPGVLTI
mmetsp:Transcript_93636/g.214160  ORF Transcript_93636/g.214160 Transcript_93636/m.214160 type:complete len:349 (+) Transcript_93636:363-1409(+)